MINNLRNSIIRFIESEKETPFLAAIASGLYPLLYYYHSNFTVINSWEQFLFFTCYFLGIPLLLFKLFNVLSSRFTFLKQVNKYSYTILNFSWFSYLIVIISFGFKLKFIFLAVFVAVFLAVLFKKHYKKVIVFQLLLALLVGVLLIKFILFDRVSPKSWQIQPDNIENVILKNKPNIYFIQPDGYANFSEINKGYYNFDNSNFKNYLLKRDFKLYDEYRSNYFSTLSSNSSLFSMKHHYHNFPISKIREVYNARDVIVGNNPVIEILSNNKYKTHLLLDKSYVLINHPEMKYDYCNIQANELSYFSRGFQLSRDIFSDLKLLQENSSNEPNFYFLEELSPSHVTNQKSPGNTADKEREKYLERLQDTNEWLEDLIDYIEENDPNSLIIIAADHGGFVGMNTSLEASQKQTDRDLVFSIFTSQLAIKWPNRNVPDFDDKLKTSVNLFRIIFSHLSDDKSYLNHLEEDKSYIQIESGAPFGLYEYINGKGEVVFKKVSKD